MKSREEVTSTSRSRSGDGNSTSLDVSTTVSDFLEQERFCKELYLSFGVQAQDMEGSSDDDVASILEEMNRLQPVEQRNDRNIEDIMREAESLLESGNAQEVTKSNGPLSSESAQQGGKDKCVAGSINAEKTVDVVNSRYHRHVELPKNNQKVQNSTKVSESLVHNKDSDVNRTDVKTQDQDKYLSTLPEESSGDNMNDTFIIEAGTFVAGTPLEVTYRRIHEEIRSEVEGSVAPQIAGDFPDMRLSLPVPGLDTPSTEIPGCFNLEQEFLEERKRCLKLKADLDWLRKQHEREVRGLREKHEEQLLQVRDELQSKKNKDPQVLALEKEIASQEMLIVNYVRENEKMCAELKTIKRALLRLMALLKADSGIPRILP